MLCTIVVVTYNSSRVIEDCLRPIGHEDEFQVVVVDNESSDATVDIVRRFPGVEVVASGSNVGFARAVNLGMARAEGECILLLNPDAVISKATILALVRRLRSDHSVGVLAPRLSDGQGMFQTINAGREPTVWRMFTHLSGLSKVRGLPMGPRNEVLEGHYLFSKDVGETARTVDWVSGGCMLIRREAWAATGGLSTRWFMYAEDIEFCHRVRACGWKVVIDPTLSAFHAIGGSSLNVDGQVRSSWLTSLYDYYCMTLAKSRYSTVLWRSIVRCGFGARAGISWLLLRTTRGKQALHTRNYRRFRSYTGFALRADEADAGSDPIESEIRHALGRAGERGMRRLL